MKILQRIKSTFFYDGLTKEGYLSVYQDIHEQNRKSMVLYTILMSFIFLILFGETFFVPSIEVNRLPYGVALSFSTILCIILLTLAKGKWVVTCIINYIFCTIILGFCTYIGTYTAQGQLATSFCVALVILPFVTYDIGIRSSIFRFIMCMIFFAVDFTVKDYDFVSRDIVNVSCYFVLGTVAAAVTQNVRSEAFYLRRNMNDTIKKQTKKIENLSIQSITAMAAAVDAKDKYTNGHSLRVAKYSKLLSAAMGKSVEEQEKIYSIAILHDIGKIGIPDSIINKPSKLTDEEYDVIKMHPIKGYEILKSINELPDIAIGARYHHEHYDGSGYPEGLKGESIPETARIIAVADAYDAMSSNRSYRSILPQQVIYNEIKNGLGTQFDPSIGKHMLTIIENDVDYLLHE